MDLSQLRVVLDARRAAARGPAAVERRRRVRLAAIVRFARTNSAYFQELYADLPDAVTEPTILSVMSKHGLMSEFDRWLTDPAVTLEGVRAFVGDPDRVGDRFAARYTALTASGTTGARGIFLWDDQTLGVTNALALRRLGAWLGPKDVLRILAARGRFAMIMASGSHFASATAAARPANRLGRRFRAIPVDTPLPTMVAELERLRPAMVAPYAGIASILAGSRRRAGCRSRRSWSCCPRKGCRCPSTAGSRLRSVPRSGTAMPRPSAPSVRVISVKMDPPRARMIG